MPTPKMLPCDGCGQETTQTHELLGVPCCPDCESTEPYRLITKTEAKELYKLRDKDITSLRCLSRQNPRFKRGPAMRLFLQRDVADVARRPDIIERHEKQLRAEQQRPERELAHRLMIATEYGNWRNALLPAAQALFNLNRYAKWTTCREDHRLKIYRLKRELIKILYQSRLATSVGLHTVSYDAKVCRRCDGTGRNRRHSYEECSGCEGTGNFREASQQEFLVFQFAVDDQPVCWHQPKEDVAFTYTMTEAVADFDGEAKEKPIPMRRNKFADAQRLIQFVIDDYVRDQAARSTVDRDPCG
jgi:hypothetical protein